MNNFRVPPSPTWYTAPVCSPENGLFYIAGNHTSIAYLPPSKNESSDSKSSDAIKDASNVRIIQTHHQFKAIACDPNWITTKWFVTMNEQNMIWVWNLDTEKICRGHKAHVIADRDSDSHAGGVMCITKNRQVLSLDRSVFVRYCLTSNTYSTFPDNFILKRNTVSFLTTSPYDQDIIAVGYKNGLILIANYAESIVLQKLRGHDSEIVSLQFTLLKSESSIESDGIAKIEAKSDLKSEVKPLPKLVEKTPSKNIARKTPPSSASKSRVNKPAEKKQTRREPPKPIVDDGDMFDIHSYDYLEEEFGTISTSDRLASLESQEDRKPAISNENFNFVEECQTLRDELTCNQSDSDDSNSGQNISQMAVNMSDIRKMIKARGPTKNDSILISEDPDETIELDELSNRSTIGSSVNTAQIADLEEVIKDLNINGEPNEVTGTVYLASGAQESSVYIWNTVTGAISDKIHLKTHGRSKIPKSNCTIAWVRPNEFVVNGPDGKISQWKTETTGSDNLKFSLVDANFPDTAVINICSNVDYGPKDPTLWTFSTYLTIFGHTFNDQSSKVVSKLATLPIGMCTLRECPHDPNKIAIAGNNKRINILDLSTLKDDNVDIQSLTSKIQGRVSALAWHPTNENLLSFSTNEGRVGTFNINKIPNPPDLIKNFNGKDLYGLSYGIDANTKKCKLYASNSQKLMTFNENSTKQDDHKAIEFRVPVSTVSTTEKYIAVSFTDGTLKIYSNDEQRKELFSETLSKKYLADMSWSPMNQSKLAVPSNDSNIFIFEDSDEGFKKTGQLVGHVGGVTVVNWSSQSEHRLVSAIYDFTVRVWNTETLECIAWSEYENKMYCAAFMPTDENFIVCSGLSETMHIFEIAKRLVANVGQFDGKKKKKSISAEVQWATQLQSDVSKARLQEKRKLKKLEKKGNEHGDDISDSLQALKISPAPVKLNHTTILYLTSKELNKDPLEYLQRVLSDPNSTENKSKEFLHSKLFGNREDIVQLLNDELQNHKGSKTESIGNLLIAQINFELKANIIQSIEEKRLTEQHVSLAPSISYEFWKNASLAYATQCIEKGLVLQAIPHLLAVHQINEAIEKLCEANFYREAWCIAKIYKEPEEDIFETIVDQWIKHLDQMGNLEGASLISLLAGKRELSFEILNKRKTKTPQIEDILNSLSQKTN